MKLLEIERFVADEDEIASVREHERQTLLWWLRRRTWRRDSFFLGLGDGRLLTWFGGFYRARWFLFGHHRNGGKNRRQKAFQLGRKLCRFFSRGKLDRYKRVWDVAAGRPRGKQ